ncbi:nuclease-related domain-containing protein [Blastococcus sp. SYSU DS0753]
MHIVEANKPSRTEGQFGPTLAGSQGLLILCPFVSQGGRTRELDGIAITPHRITVIEGKATQMKGHLIPALNGPWTIGGEPADFAGDKNPYVQARQAAQLLKAAAVDARVPSLPFIHFGVAVAGEGFWTAGYEVKLGDGKVVMMENLANLASPVDVGDCNHDVTIDTATAFLRMLGLSVDEATLRAEGFLTAPEAAAKRSREEQAGQEWRQGNEARYAELKAELQSHNCPCGVPIESLKGDEVVQHYKEHTRELRDELHKLAFYVGKRSFRGERETFRTVWYGVLPDSELPHGVRRARQEGRAVAPPSQAVQRRRQSRRRLRSIPGRLALAAVTVLVLYVGSLIFPDQTTLLGTVGFFVLVGTAASVYDKTVGARQRYAALRREAEQEMAAERYRNYLDSPEARKEAQRRRTARALGHRY